MNTKEALAKLVKIAENQQKIITKLAQMAPPSALDTKMSDVTQAVAPYLQQAAQAVGSKTPYAVQNGSLSHDGTLHVTVTQPAGHDVGDYYSVKNKLKEMLANKSLNTTDGQALPVKMVNVTGMTA
jgi:hypothetical protein